MPLPALLAIGVASGCATMARGTHQMVYFDSVPQGAVVSQASTGQSWITPAEVSLPRGNRQNLVVTKEGYVQQDVYIRSEVPFSWWAIDALTLGISTIADAIMGGLYDLKPDHVMVVLEREPAQSPPTPPP